MGSKNKGSGVHDDMKKWAKDKVDKGQKKLEQERDTGGKGQAKGKDK